MLVIKKLLDISLYDDLESAARDKIAIVDPRYEEADGNIVNKEMRKSSSNPRPNKATPKFLHVYLAIDCRLRADHEQPTTQRSPVKFAPGVGPTVS